jgi:hypothetical protein
MQWELWDMCLSDTSKLHVQFGMHKLNLYGTSFADSHGACAETVSRGGVLCCSVAVPVECKCATTVEMEEQSVSLEGRERSGMRGSERH